MAKTIPFQIVDRWGGVWDLEAYEETTGRRGFTIRRVCYAGRQAALVAECVGFEKPNRYALKPSPRPAA